MYEYGLNAYGRIGWIACFLFMACGALRLARFNVMSGIGKASGDFTGLPIPMAATVIATFVLFMTDLAAHSEATWLGRLYANYLAGASTKGSFLIVVAPALSLAMVSNIVYRSHKALKIRGIKPFKLLAASIFVIALLAYQPEAVGFSIAALYALSGPFEWALGWKKPTEDDDIFTPQEDHSIMEPHHEAHDGPVEAPPTEVERESIVRRLAMRARGQDPT
jgi:CDP-diacylglycerol--serine O-phosphatidyltransferase